MRAYRARFTWNWFNSDVGSRVELRESLRTPPELYRIRLRIAANTMSPMRGKLCGSRIRTEVNYRLPLGPRVAMINNSR